MISFSIASDRSFFSSLCVGCFSTIRGYIMSSFYSAAIISIFWLKLPEGEEGRVLWVVRGICYFFLGAVAWLVAALDVFFWSK